MQLDVVTICPKRPILFYRCPQQGQWIVLTMHASTNVKTQKMFSVYKKSMEFIKLCVLISLSSSVLVQSHLRWNHDAVENAD